MIKLLQPLRHIVQAVFVAGLFLPILPAADVIGEKIWLTTIFIGVFFCGWCCPFGTAQEWIGIVARRLHVPRFRPSPTIQQYLQISRYFLYGLSALGITFFFLNARYYFDHNLVMNMLNWFSGGTLAVFLLFAIFVDRPFCNYFCLKGAADGMLSTVRPLSIARLEERCIHCHLCDKNCPMHILVEQSKFVRHPNCINCFKCISVCPKNCLKYKPFGFFKQKNKGEK